MSLFLPLISKSIEAIEFYLYNKGRKAFLTVYDNLSFTETPFTKFTVPEQTGKPEEFSLIIKEMYYRYNSKPGPDKVLYTQGSTELFRNISSNNTEFFSVVNDDVSGTKFVNKKGECFTGDEGSTKILWKSCEVGSPNQIWKIVEDHKIVYMWEKMLTMDEDMKEALEKINNIKNKIKINKKNKKHKHVSSSSSSGNSSNSSSSDHSHRGHKKHKKHNKNPKDKDHNGITDILDQIIPPNDYMPKHEHGDNNGPISDKDKKLEALKEIFPGLNGPKHQICDRMWKVMCKNFSCCK